MSTKKNDTRLINPCEHEPYPGLRPYEEEEQAQFFGRDADTRILLDKVLTHRLTLLFAATGVGKSSLLKAAVIPKLKSASGKHLDVVYYNDWVTTPLSGLKAEIASTMRRSANWPQGTQLDENLSLAEFVQFCTLFIRPPLVIMLDQFEELFRYRTKYHTNSFRPFIEELTGLITATRIPVSVVFSMREDFALELNAFKPKLPTLLFENYYRLERLPAQAARDAIVEPLRRVNFRYEPVLLEQLLQDLLKQDTDRDLSSLGADDETETVIPPQLQIVCSQLWQKECADPDRTIHLAVYEAAGRAEGLLKNYVEKALKTFSEKDRRVLSRAFDHLVSIQGTKMPHTVATLAEKISFNTLSLRRLLWRVVSRIAGLLRVKTLPGFIAKLRPDDAETTRVLQRILEKLASQEVRILRSQQREQKTWYELYHDMYSESINGWNRVQKRKMLWRQVKIWGSTVSGVLLLVFFSTIAIVHSLSHHLRLAAGDENRVEIFTGKQGWLDPFRQQQFYSETRLLSRDIEPDKRFQQRGLLDYQEISTDLIAYRPLEERIAAYVYTGNYAKAFELFEKTINSGGKQASAVVRGLFSLKNRRSFRKIKPLAASEKNATGNKIALTLFQENINALDLDKLDEFRFYEQVLRQREVYRVDWSHINNSPQLFEKILNYLNHSHPTFRGQAASALGLIGDRVAVAALVKALSDDNEYVRRNAASALGLIGDRVAVAALVKALSDDNEYVRRNAAEALGLIGDRVAVAALVKALSDDNKNVRLNAASALGLIGDRVAVAALVKALSDDNEYVRRNAAEALGLIGDRVAVAALVKALSDDNEDVRRNAAEALGLIGDRVAVAALVKALSDDNEDVRLNAAEALGLIGDRVAVAVLVKALSDDNEDVRRNAAEALGLIGDRVAVAALVKALSDDNEDVRLNAASALGLIGDRVAVAALVKALSDDNEYVRRNAAEALGLIGDRVAVAALVKALSDDNEDVRLNAASALGLIGDRVAVAALVKALSDDNEYVRRYAAEALGRIGDRVAVAALVKALSDDNEGVRRYAAEALGRIGDRVAVAALVKALSDDNEYVRLNAAEALGRIGDLSGIKFKRLAIDNKVDQPTKPYRWYDYFLGWSFSGRLREIYGTVEHRQQLLAALNLPIPAARDLLLLQLATNPEAHHTIREKAIEELGKTGVNKQKIIAELQTLHPEQAILQRAITTTINKLTTEPEPQRDPAENKVEIPQLKTQLKELEQQHAEWRIFRDSKTQENFPKPEDYDQFLDEVRAKKAQIPSTAAFDHAYAITTADPKTGLTLLTHPLARARQGAYTAFMMKANIQWLKKLDTEREQRRNDPIFRHAAFRAIDLGLWRLEVLGNKNNNDQEYKELKAWQDELENDNARKQTHINAGDTYKTGEDAGHPVDEVLERLQWTTLMMEHTKKMTAKYAKDGWVRDWPENALPVNQPYPELED